MKYNSLLVFFVQCYYVFFGFLHFVLGGNLQKSVFIFLFLNAGGGRNESQK